MTKSTRGDWRVLVTVGMAVLLASMVGVASQAATDKACVKGCKSEKSICLQFFKNGLKTARSACEALTGTERRQCIAAAKADRNEGRGRCKAAFKGDCKVCCTGADTSGCGVRVCGDGQQVAGEGCEPPGTASCDDQCRLITTTTTTTSTTTTTIPGAGASAQVSAPPNGTHFVAGDAPSVTVVLNDDAGNPLTLEQLSTANLYMYGPQDQSRTTTAVALLRASTDRNARPHHYIDLKTNPDVVADGNVITYPLSAVTDELPGTYTVTVWAVLAADGLQQWMPLADCQIGTPDAETQTVEKNQCGACHLGAKSGKFYLHHIDPGFSPAGNWALDSWPVRTCKSCHNQNGYAGYNNGTGGTDANSNRTTDPIVRRVHGVHMGADLKAPFNIDPDTGDFKDYIEVEFPADVRNCTRCHVDDMWKTEPARLACGACHDNIWFGDAGATPAGWENHPGGPQANDSACTACHPPDTGVAPIAVAHAVPPPPLDAVDVTLTPPTNGEYYTAGETPLVTIVIRDDNGDPIDHTQVTSGNFTTAGLFVSGNRSHTVPVLTNTATFGASKLRASVSNNKAASGSPASWTFTGTDTFKIAVNGDAPLTLSPPVGDITPAEVAAWLTTDLAGVTGGVTVTSSASTNRVTIKSNVQGGISEIDIYNSPVTTIMEWKSRGTLDGPGGTPLPPGVTVDPQVFLPRSSYPINDLRALSDVLDYADPSVTRSNPNITYQLGDVAGLPAGTYSLYAWSQPGTGKIAGLTNKGIGFVNFQVGTATAEKKVATNCTNCHGDTIMHISNHPAWFDTDYCKSCHDYGHDHTGEGWINQGGTSMNGWSGFGAAPIARRVHGVHFGHYVEHTNEIYSGTDEFGEVIFPQDVRNCTKCHAETDTWTEKPSRVACLACHDSDAAKAHGQLMTWIPDPLDPYGPTAVESCEVCHGADADFAPSVVHNVWDPYRAPYPREP